ncbi:MAG: hypothetical protein H0W15_11175 [Gemmatimonadales bacterium]|nr:hypothetical protein [Gemmatimonadales bacterium]
MMWRRLIVRSVMLAVVIGVPVDIVAQVRDMSPPMARAQSAERRGQYAEAAIQYNLVLDERPTDDAALNGLERVLVPLGRGAELARRLARALDSDSLNVGLLGLAVRTFAGSGQADSAARYAERWAQIEPGIDGPYREWAIAAVEGRDRESARRALETGRRILGRPGALAPELAQVLQLDGNWAGATQEWLRAAEAQPAYRMSAVAALARAPVTQRPAIRTALGGARSVEAPPVRALLEARWGDIAEGTRIALAALPAGADQAVILLRAMVEETKGHEQPPALRARGALLEALAAHETPAAGLRTRMDAARAYADAGDEANARRLLAVVAADPAAPDGIATSASATLLGVLLAEGRADEADRVLTQILPSLDADERERQSRRVALAHARRGNFGRADALVAADSSVAGFDLRGRIRLLQGDLAGATEFLRLAGPYDTQREHAVERVTLLVLLQAVGRDTMQALGAAITAIEVGDTADAIARLGAIAEGLEPQGAAACRLLAGHLAVAVGDTAAATRLWRSANVAEAPASAAEARYSLARVERLGGRADAARELLESLLLEFPDSAIVPEARRLYDQVRGATPGGG